MQAILLTELTSSKGVKIDESTASALIMLLTMLSITKLQLLRATREACNPNL